MSIVAGARVQFNNWSKVCQNLGVQRVRNSLMAIVG